MNYFAIPGLTTQKAVSTEDIINVVCKYFAVPSHLLKEKTRKGNIVHARFMAMYLFYNHTRLTKRAIGEYFNRDHTSVIHGIRVIENFMSLPDLYKTKQEFIYLNNALRT